MSDERRKHDRTEMVLKVEYQEPTDLLADYLTDLGEGGLFLCTSVPFDIGQSITFSVSFPGLLDPIQLDGVVRWRREPDIDSPEVIAGVGVEFVFSSDEHQAKVLELVTRLRRDEGIERVKLLPDTFQVLLVEDNPFAHNLFQHAIKKYHLELKSAGILVIESAYNGQDALEKIEHKRFDMAIIDYFLPIMTGSELIQRIRDNPDFHNTPILVVSVGGEGVRESAIEAGADLYLDKPVMLKQLISTFHALLTLTAQQQQAHLGGD